MATALTRRRPFEDFAELHTRIDRMFEDLVAGGKRGEWTPAIDVIRDNGMLVVRADMPGINGLGRARGVQGGEGREVRPT